MKTLISLLTISFLLFSFACKKDDDDDNSTTQVDEYYVKYSMNATSRLGTLVGLRVAVKNENNSNYIFSTDRTFETIIGPVSRNFEAEIDVSNERPRDDYLELYVDIYVSKNNSPFALKALDYSDIPRENVTLRYTINY